MNRQVNLRIRNLEQILITKFIPADEILRHSTGELTHSPLWNELQEVYNGLGGKGAFPTLTLGSFHLNLGTFSVELDDSLQFNRYRLASLRAPFYSRVKSFDLMKYRSFCKKYENDCLKSGCSVDQWTNNLAEKSFGKGEEPGDLGLNGSPGWKLRAIEAMAKDAIVLHKKLKVIRLSVWDELLIKGKIVRLNELLMNPGKDDSEMVLKFVERRLLKLYS